MKFYWTELDTVKSVGRAQLKDQLSPGCICVIIHRISEMNNGTLVFCFLQGAVKTCPTALWMTAPEMAERGEE